MRCSLILTTCSKFQQFTDDIPKQLDPCSLVHLTWLKLHPKSTFGIIPKCSSPFQNVFFWRSSAEILLGSVFWGVFIRVFWSIFPIFFLNLCWVFFRMLSIFPDSQQNWCEDLFFLVGLTSILPNFPGYFLVLCIFPSFIVFTDFNSTFEVFFRVLSIFPNFARKKCFIVQMKLSLEAPSSLHLYMGSNIWTLCLYISCPNNQINGHIKYWESFIWTMKQNVW